MNTGGPASEKTLLDEFAGQALAGFFGFISETQAAMKDADLPGIKREQVSRECYDQAESMLAEKARREAVVQQSSTTQDAEKVAELQAANRELVEALELFVDNVAVFVGNSHPEVNSARAILAKHKGAA